jgi:hypothetical protein
MYFRTCAFVVILSTYMLHQCSLHAVAASAHVACSCSQPRRALPSLALGHTVQNPGYTAYSVNIYIHLFLQSTTYCRKMLAQHTFYIQCIAEMYIYVVRRYPTLLRHAMCSLHHDDLALDTTTPTSDTLYYSSSSIQFQSPLSTYDRLQALHQPFGP